MTNFKNASKKIIVLILSLCFLLSFVSCKVIDKVKDVKENVENKTGQNSNNNNNGNNSGNKSGIKIVDGINETTTFNKTYMDRVTKSINDDKDDSKVFSSMSVVSVAAYHVLSVGFVSLSFLADNLADLGIIKTEKGSIEHKQGVFILTETAKDFETNSNGESKWTISEDGYTGKNESVYKDENQTVVKRSFYEYSFKNNILYIQSYTIKPDRLNEGKFKESITQACFEKGSFKSVSGDISVDTVDLTLPKSIYNNHPSSLDSIADSNAKTSIIDATSNKITLTEEGKSPVTWDIK